MGLVGRWQGKGFVGVLISCIMPTRGRAQFAHLAVEAFMLQSWAERELIILDDADAPSFDVVPQFENIHYFTLETRLKIGDKRNLAIERSHGQIVAHWDDDDYSAPMRLEDQIERLMSTGMQMTGYSSMLFKSEGGSVDLYDDANPKYIIGTSLMYRREYWEKHRFRSLQMGEDDLFKGFAMREGTSISVPAGDLMFARIHGGNTVSKRPAGSRWKKVAA